MKYEDLKKGRHHHQALNLRLPRSKSRVNMQTVKYLSVTKNFIFIYDYCDFYCKDNLGKPRQTSKAVGTLKSFSMRRDQPTYIHKMFAYLQNFGKEAYLIQSSPNWKAIVKSNKTNVKQFK